MLSLTKLKELQQQREETAPETPAVAKALIVQERYYGRTEDGVPASQDELTEAVAACAGESLKGAYVGNQHLNSRIEKHQTKRAPEAKRQGMVDAISQAILGKRVADEPDDDDLTR